MSDIQLRSEIETLIKASGFEKSKSLICPITKIVSMRYRDVPQKQITKIARSIARSIL
jgi:hypothetical protein